MSALHGCSAGYSMAVRPTNYLPTWKHDPTIQGMLVVLDACTCITAAATAINCTARQRLAIRKTRPSAFLAARAAQNSITTAIPVKMNSRGRPLTTFKAGRPSAAAEHRHLTARWTPDSRKISTRTGPTYSGRYRGDNHRRRKNACAYRRFLGRGAGVGVDCPCKRAWTIF